jgi:hypothetical protein
MTTGFRPDPGTAAAMDNELPAGQPGARLTDPLSLLRLQQTIPEMAKPLSGIIKNERLVLEGPGSAACSAGLRPG